MSVLLFLIWACGSERPSGLNETTSIEKYQSIVLIGGRDSALTYASDTTTGTAGFHILYLGRDTDSIRLNYARDNQIHQEEQERFWYPTTPKQLSITVDTSRLIGAAVRYRPSFEDWERKSEGFEFPKCIRQYLAYPVFIRSNTTDTVVVADGDYIPISLEAVDSNGFWKPIQKRYRYKCGTGLPQTYITFNQVLLTTCKLYQGEYKTKMRLVFGWYSKSLTYSNTFTGTIHYSQFLDEEYDIYPFD